MKLWSESFKDGKPIPGEYAFGIMDAASHVALSANRNPHLAWSDLPAGTRSLAIICHDRDVPSRGDDVNQEGKAVPADLPRIDFFHWVLVDLSPDKTSVAPGEYSHEVTARGKPGPGVGAGKPDRQGVNDYTAWFAADETMSGDYYGYDGPCPPWNDEIVHHYVFTLYALDVDRLPLEGRFNGQQALEAMKGHILDQASIVGVYSLNPAVAAKMGAA